MLSQNSWEMTHEIFGYVYGQQSTKKIAIVTLPEGEKIEAFGV